MNQLADALHGIFSTLAIAILFFVIVYLGGAVCGILFELVKGVAS